MSTATDQSSKLGSSKLTLDEASRRAPELLREYIATHTKEELAERLTTYQPGIPHYWFGRPVAPLTKEDLLYHWNGGPEPEIRYLDGKDSEGNVIPAEA